MSKREIAAIIALMIAGFVAYAVISQFQDGDPNEVAPGETPTMAAGAGERGGAPAEMKAWVPAAPAVAIHAAMSEELALSALPAEAGLLAIAGGPGELFFTRRSAGRSEVCIMRAAGTEVIWSTETDRVLEIVGSRGPELLLKFTDVPFVDPAAAWQPGGFLALDVTAAGEGLHPIAIDEETVARIRSTMRRP
jgi:hypothetical protein